MKKIKIEEVKKLCLDALKYIIQICEKNNLTIFAAYGTLLGAVREHGFIDWDDDVDLWMMRDQYNKLGSIMLSEQSNDYFFQTFVTDPYGIDPEMARICIKKTQFWNPSYLNRKNFDQSIFIDIFPLDFSSNNFKFAEEKYKKIRALHKRIYLQAYYPFEEKSLLNRIKRYIRKIYPYKIAIRRLIYIMENNKDIDYEKLICYPLAFRYAKVDTLETNYFDEVVYLDFEDIKIPCPQKYELILKKLYGSDYMTPKKYDNIYASKYLLED